MRRIFYALIGLLLGSSSALAADLAVISGGAVRTGLIPATAAFEDATGRRVELVFNSTPQIKQRLAEGDVFDVIIAPPGAMSGFREAGEATSDGVAIGRVGAGVVARRGAWAPDIATPDQLKQALLEADAVVFNRSSSGLYIETLMTQMGVWAQIEAKTVRFPRSDGVMERLLKGGGKELGFGPITGILAYEEQGLTLVAPLPPEVQKLRTYSAAATPGENSDLAEAYIAFLAGPKGKPFFLAAGIE